jgi:hypothetical protein
MTDSTNIFADTPFDSETLRVLIDAYDKVCKSLHDTGQPPIVTEVIAHRMIALAKAGERDPDRLCAGALMALGNKAVFE